MFAVHGGCLCYWVRLVGVACERKRELRCPVSGLVGLSYESFDGCLFHDVEVEVDDAFLRVDYRGVLDQVWWHQFIEAFDDLSVSGCVFWSEVVGDSERL